jgi:simple sugar transport system permease protein
VSVQPITLAPPRSSLAWRDKLPILTTCLTCVLLYVVVCRRYPGFFALQNTVDLLRNNAVLGIAALGMTFVILSGGIDLSVGAVVGCGSIFIATRIENHQWPPLAAFAVTLLGGTTLGVVMGCLIHFFEIPAFLATLGGLFFVRGLGLLISTEAISIDHPMYVTTFFNIEHLFAPRVTLSIGMIAFVCLLAFSMFVAGGRPIGRYVYAVGGNAQSALLMGLPVGRTRISVYAFSGFCAALAAIVTTIDTTAGNALNSTGMELDAIATVVVGGTLLSGGVGSVLGTLVGILIFGIIQSAISFDGRLSSWWSRIAVGVLLLIFILLQKLLQPRETQP